MVRFGLPQFAVEVAKAEKQVMAMIEEIGAAKKRGFVRQVQPSAQVSDSSPEKVLPVESPSIPSIVPECKPIGAGSGGLTADQLMLKIQQEEDAVRGDTPGKAAGELKEAIASVPNEFPAVVSSGALETAPKQGGV